MPTHDWTRVIAGTYHDFHNSWITHLKEALNAGILPAPYYAQGEQRAGNIQPDVLALHETNGEEGITPSPREDGGLVAIAEAPPSVHLSQEASLEAAFYLAKRRSLVIRHASGDRVIALVEIVSPANKHTNSAVEDFLDTVLAALRTGIHVLLIDPIPPSKYDPHGLHTLIWEELGEPTVSLPVDRPLTLVSYRAGSSIAAYVEPTAVGLALTEMPLLLTRTHYVRTPLEVTYMQAWAGVPERWRRVIEV
jgi:Protein of unknown function (DUF4058)